MESFNVGVIGTGNMGTAITSGLINSGLIMAEKINIYDVDERKTNNLKNKHKGINILTNNMEIISKSDVIILATKPDSIEGILRSCKHSFTRDKIIISIAVGIPIKFCKSIIGPHAKIIRAMPNAPSLIGAGITLLAHDKDIDQTDINFVDKIFKSMGEVHWLDEKLMTQVTSITASSPAYVFMFVEAMADAAVLHGIPRDLAYRLSAYAIQGSVKMLLNTNMHPAQLKDLICSPAGTTIEAVVNLEKNGFRYSIMEAILKCNQKAQSIEDQFTEEDEEI